MIPLSAHARLALKYAACRQQLIEMVDSQQLQRAHTFLNKRIKPLEPLLAGDQDAGDWCEFGLVRRGGGGEREREGGGGGGGGGGEGGRKREREREGGRQRKREGKQNAVA